MSTNRPCASSSIALDMNQLSLPAAHSEPQEPLSLARPSPRPSLHFSSTSSLSRAQQHAEAKKVKARPIYSCLPCKKRKVKCDRTKPCKACVLRGEASGCEYELGDAEREAVTQADKIARLSKQNDDQKRVIAELERRLALLEGGASPSSSHSSSDVASTASTLLTPVSAGSSPPLDILTSTVTWPQVHAMFLQRFVDRYEHRVRVNRPGEHWMTEVAQYASPDQSVLSGVLHASAMGLAGSEDNHPELQYQAQQLYTASLNKLQVALRSSDAHNPEILYATMLMSLYELLVLNNTMSWLLHLEGVGRLIEHRTPYKHIYGLEHRTFRFFRIFGITLTVLTRKPSFLAKHEWKTVPWSVGYPGKTVLDFLLDHVVEIPGFYAIADDMKRRKDAGDLEELPNMQRTLMTGIAKFRHNIQRWKEDYVATYPGLQPVMVDGEVDDDIWKTSHVSSIDLTLTQAMSIYYAAQLLLLRVDPSTPSLADPAAKVKHLVEMICQSCEFQLGCEQDFFGALAMLFPLRVAMFTPLGNSDLYKLRLGKCFARLSANFRLAFANSIQGSVLPSFAGRVNMQRRENQPHPAVDQ